MTRSRGETQSASPKALDLRVTLEQYLEDLLVEQWETLPWFGEVESQLVDQGQAVTEFDLRIAATALAHGLTLVTHNVQDFVTVPSLAIDDWLGP